MRNTIRKVTMVVPVLMISCQVSLKPKTGPLAIHSRITSAAALNAAGRPVALAVDLAKRVNQVRERVGLILRPSQQFECPLGHAEGDVPVIRPARGAVVAIVGHEAEADDVAGLLAIRTPEIFDDIAPEADPLAGALRAAFGDDQAHPVGVR